MIVAAKKARQKKSSFPLPNLPSQGGREKGAALLSWYDQHRRKLPWRAAPGERPDAYRVWLSEVMLQQTTVQVAAPNYVRFLARWPSVHDLAAASLQDVLGAWAGLGYYARARNLHACAKALVERHAGRFPERVEALAALPGIGPYTAAAIAAIAFDQRTVPIDGNVARVISRLFALEAALPAAKSLRRLAETLLPPHRAGDFAQALMDLGATVCTPKKPACSLCPWSQSCLARARGDQETFPRKPPKAAGRLRRGAAFVALRADGALLLRTTNGLLGGMSEVPTSAWTHEFDEKAARKAAPNLSLPANGKGRIAWRRISGAVSHRFTHFPLELIVYVARVAAQTPAPAGMRWVARSALAREALPSVMRKVLAHADSGKLRLMRS